MSIKDKKQVYHLTALSNMNSILTYGLLPRSEVDEFTDVADPEILAKRRELDLHTKVPFHFFTRNPFDGAVTDKYPDKDFVIIAVDRSLAEKQNWWVVDKHPLAIDMKLYKNYKDGFAAIDWDLMDKRKYKENECKQVCMAECVALGAVPVSDFSCIYVKNDRVKKHVEALLREHGIRKYVNAYDYMFC